MFFFSSLERGRDVLFICSLKWTPTSLPKFFSVTICLIRPTFSQASQCYTVKLVTAIRDFKQRQRGRRRGRHSIRENPKGPLRMTSGELVDVLRSGPT